MKQHYEMHKKGETVNDDYWMGEVVSALTEMNKTLDSIDTTLKEISEKLDEPQTMREKLHTYNTSCIPCGIDVAELREEIRNAVRRERGDVIIRDIVPEWVSIFQAIL